MPRPREFDINTALDKALDAFWEKGYEATSLADLMKAMNLKKGSIYQTFGDKHSLFIQTLTKYTNYVFQVYNDTFDQAKTPYKGLESLLTDVLVNFAAGAKKRKGCFETNTLVELGPHDKKVRQILDQQKDRSAKLFAKQILKGQQDNEIRSDIDSTDLGIQMSTLIAGIMADCKIGKNKERTLKITKTFLKTIKA